MDAIECGIVKLPRVPVGLVIVDAEDEVRDIAAALVADPAGHLEAEALILDVGQDARVRFGDAARHLSSELAALITVFGDCIGALAREVRERTRVDETTPR